MFYYTLASCLVGEVGNRTSSIWPRGSGGGGGGGSGGVGEGWGPIQGGEGGVARLLNNVLIGGLVDPLAILPGPAM